MKTINIIQNQQAGSCSSCQKFQDDFIYWIDYEKHFCSVRCLLTIYSNGELKIMWRILLPKNPMFATRTNTINSLAKEM